MSDGIRVEVRDGVAILPISDFRKAIGPKLDTLLDHDAVEGVRIIRNGRPAYHVTAPEDSDNGANLLTLSEDGVEGSVDSSEDDSSKDELDELDQ